MILVVDKSRAANRRNEPLNSTHLSTPMTDIYLRPGKILGTFSRLYPDAWKQVDEFRARRKELGDWPDWCFLPLAGTYAIVSKGKTLQSPNQAHHIGILGALAAWRVTQGIYRFDPTTLTPSGRPRSPETSPPKSCSICLSGASTSRPLTRPGREPTLNGFFAHLECDMNDRRTELRLVLDVTGPAGDELIVMPIHLGKGGVAEGVEAMLKEAARHFPARVQTPEGVLERLSSDVSPSGLPGPLPLLPSRRGQGGWCRKACADSSQAPEDQEGFADLRPGSPEPVGGRVSPRGCFEAGVVGASTSGTDRHPCQPSSPYPQGALALVLGGEEGSA